MPYQVSLRSWVPLVTSFVVVVIIACGGAGSGSTQTSGFFDTSQEIYGLAFNRDGTRFAVANGRDIGVYDLRSGEAIRSFSVGGWNAPRCVAFSSDGKTLAADSRRDLELWDLDTGQHLASLSPNDQYDDGPSCAVFSPDGRTIVTGSWRNGTARLFDAKTGQLVTTLSDHSQGIWDVKFSPSGALIATASEDATVILWDAVTGRRRIELSHRGPVYSVDFSPDGTRIVTGSKDASHPIQPGKVLIWDVQRGNVIRRLEGEHRFAVTAVAFSPDGRFVVEGSKDFSVKVWDLEKNEIQTVLESNVTNAPVITVGYSGDGKTLMAGGGGDGHTGWVRMLRPKTAPTVENIQTPED